MLTKVEILERMANLDAAAEVLELLRSFLLQRPILLDSCCQTEAIFPTVSVATCVSAGMQTDEVSPRRQAPLGANSRTRVGPPRCVPEKAFEVVGCRAERSPFCTPVAPVVGCSTVRGETGDVAWTEVVRRGTRRATKGAPLLLDSRRAPGVVGPVPLQNRFQSLAGEVDKTGQDEVVVIGDSIVRGLRLPSQKKAVVYCYPGTRLEHVTQRVPAILSRSSRAPTVVACCGGNNVPLDTARGVAERLCHLVRTVRRVRPDARVVVSNILPRFSRDTADGRMVKRMEYRAAAWEVLQFCKGEGVEVVDATARLLRETDRCFRRDGVHLTSRGSFVLGDTIDRALRKYPVHSRGNE